MFRPDIDLVRVIHAERVERDLDAVQAARAIAHASRPSAVRRAVGRSIVRVGAWIAAEQAAEPARQFAEPAG